LVQENLGHVLQEQPASREGVRWFREAIAMHDSLVPKLNPPKWYRYRVAWLYLRLGMKLQALGEIQEAVTVHQQGLELLKPLGFGYNELLFQQQLGLALARSSQWQAIAQLPLVVPSRITVPPETLAKDLTSSSDPVVGRAVRELNQKRLEVLVRELEKAKTERERAHVYHNLARALATHPEPRFCGDPKRAVELATAAIMHGSEVATYWNTLGIARYRAGDWKLAIEALKKSMELHAGGDASDWLFLAMAHRQLGDKVQAGRWYHKAVEWMEKHDPDDKVLGRFRSEAQALLGVAELAPPPKLDQEPRESPRPPAEKGASPVKRPAPAASR
jgi:tetratricopeptide (TPR) repeat protein